MSPISADEIDLLTFFESEPKLRDQDVPWIYNDALYEFEHDGFSLSCAIDPSYQDVRLVFKYGERLLYELNAMSVEDLIYHNDAGQESLEIILNTISTLHVVLKPTIQIIHQAHE